MRTACLPENGPIQHKQAQNDKPHLLVLASIYLRWTNDNEPGIVHELYKRMADRFEITVLFPNTGKANIKSKRILAATIGELRAESL